MFKKLALLLVLITATHALTAKEYPACRSELGFRMLTNASIAGDMDTIKELILLNQCFYMNEGSRVVIVKRNSVWSEEPSAFLIAIGGQWVTVYTSFEGINE